jgi:pimeloyl-ACP methyl ester carboxylesterase
VGRDNRALFLHGGPGLNAGAERLWFGDSLPICWWDQPIVSGGSLAPFGQLVAVAADQLRAMADDTGELVALIAHSFGGQIAYALAREAPELVKSITLLGCVTDPFLPLFRLCRQMAKIQSSPALEAAILDAETRLDQHSFESMVLSAAVHPAYPSVYFGPDSAAARDHFLALFATGSILNLETFLTVMNDLLNAPVLAPVGGFDGEVTLLLGRHDPLLAVDEDIVAWQRIFPQLQAQVVDCGHFVHLELPPEIWWRGDYL